MFKNKIKFLNIVSKNGYFTVNGKNTLFRKLTVLASIENKISDTMFKN